MEEDNCQFISPHGIAKIADQKPIVKGSKQFDYAFDYNNQEGETIYIQTADLENFFKNHANRFRNKFVLISGNYVTSIPDDLPESKIYIDHPKLMHWWIQNYVGGLGKKAHYLPLGIDYHTLHYNLNHAWGKQTLPKKQEQNLLKIKKNLIPIQNTISTKAIANFASTTFGHPILREQRRAPILQILQKKSCVEFLPEQKRESFWQSMCFYAFVVCPPGYGWDTHRVWETLMVGRIPIIQSSGIDKVYANLPVVKVKNWEILDEEWLHRTFNDIISKWDTYEWDRLKLSYWRDKIFHIK